MNMVIKMAMAMTMLNVAAMATPNTMATMPNEINDMKTYVEETMMNEKAKKEVEDKFKIEVYRDDEEYLYLLHIDNQIMMGDNRTMARLISSRTCWHAMIFEDNVALVDTDGNVICIELDDEYEHNEYEYNFVDGKKI